MFMFDFRVSLYSNFKALSISHMYLYYKKKFNMKFQYSKNLNKTKLLLVIR